MTTSIDLYKAQILGRLLKDNREKPVEAKASLKDLVGLNSL